MGRTDRTHMGPSEPEKGVVAALLALGATAVATQIILIREALSVFGGNELVIGIVFGCWMILTGGGAFLGKAVQRWTRPENAVPPAVLALGLVPLLTVFFLRFLRNVVFTAGSMIPALDAFLAIAVLLAPFCLVSGASFCLLATALSLHVGKNPTGAAYTWESLGSALGGFVFSLILIPRLETFQGLSLLLSANAGLAGLLALRNRTRPAALIAGLALAAGIALLVFGKLDLVTRRFLFPGQTVDAIRDTPYGNLTVIRQEGQISLFENGVLMFSTNDVTANEESVHYAMAQRTTVRQVLLIGGGIAGTTREVLKYGVERLDYAEMNPWAVQIAREFTDALDDPRIHVVTDDGRRYLRGITDRYDVALVNLPDPETIQLNRYYTIEFFDALKSTLTDSAVVSISLLPGVEYQGPEAKSTSSIVYATLRRVFANVLLVPGLRNYFLASDGALDVRIGSLIEARKVPTTYVNRYYLDDLLLEQRSRKLVGSFDPGASVNRDFEPVGYYRQIAYWLSYFEKVPGAWMLIAAAAVLLLVWRRSPVGAGIFVAGLVGISLEMIVLLVFQALAGSLYQMTGVVITSFMAGLAAGSWCARRIVRRPRMRTFAGAQLVVAVACVCLPVLFGAVRNAAPSAGAMQILFTLLAFCLAGLFGIAFALGSSVHGGTASVSSSELYGLDLAGSALGALLTSVYALPLFGVSTVSVMLGAASAASAAICFVATGRR